MDVHPPQYGAIGYAPWPHVGHGSKENEYASQSDIHLFTLEALKRQTPISVSEDSWVTMDAKGPYIPFTTHGF